MQDGCIVCGRAIPAEETTFCCPGCAAVHTIVEQLNLEGAAKDERVAQLLEGVFPGGEEVDSHEVELENGEGLSLMIEGMVCPACAWLVHHRLTKLSGVGGVNVNFLAETCDLQFDPMVLGQEQVEETIRKLGYRAYESGDTRAGVDYFRFGAGWFFALNAMMISFVVYSAESWSVPVTMQWVCSILLALFGTLVPVYAARSTMRAGFRQLSLGAFRMESLVVVSTTAAWVYSMWAMVSGQFERLYFDVVTLLLMLIESGNLITGSFYRRLHQRVSSLALKLPKKARIEGVVFASVDEMEPGQAFCVRRDEVVPTDGVAVTGAEFDFSLITGESVGVWMEPGSLVGAGARLLSDEVAMRVPPGGRSNLLERMVASTIEAFNTKREQLTLGDRISQVFVPLVALIGLAVFVLQSVSGSATEGFSRLLGVLIVACPCAFGIAEPLVLTAAIEQVRRWGIQCFNGSILAYKPSRIVFDKTGTLTRGMPEVTEVYWLVEQDAQWLDILASVENGVEHPVARACVGLGRPKSIENRVIERTTVSAEVEGKRYRAGSAACYPQVEIPASMAASTLVLFGDEKQCYLIVALRDMERSESVDVLKRMRQLGMSASIFSGDRQSVVDELARRVAVEDARGEMSSTDKQDEICRLQEQGETVMMVGDGINDAQALAAADVGVAVYSGQVPAKMSSDGVFLKPGIDALGAIPMMQRKVRKKIRLNYGWAFLYNSIGVVLAAAGWLSPKYCAVGMVFSNLVVVYNSIVGMELKQR